MEKYEVFLDKKIKSKKEKQERKLFMDLESCLCRYPHNLCKLFLDIVKFCSDEKNTKLDIKSILSYLQDHNYNAVLHEITKKKTFERFQNYHSFIVVYYNNEKIIIDVDFRSKFLIARPSPKYKKILESIPDIFIGTVDNLKKSVDLLCDEMVKSFIENGLEIPPWRQKCNILTYWFTTI